MIRKLRAKINKKGNKFLKNLLILISGSTAAQLITILVSPILTRIYSPEEFGEFAIFMALVSILTVIITLRFEIAIISPKNDKDAASILYLSILLTSVISAIIFIFALTLNEFNLLKNWTTDIFVYLFFLPLSMWFIGVYNSLRYWNIRKQNFIRTTRSQLGNSIATNTTQVTFGFIKITQSGLALGKLIGLIISGIVIGMQFLKEDFKGTRESIKLDSLKKSFKNYYQYPLFNVPQALLSSLSINLIPIIIGLLYNSLLVGVYALTIRVLFVPVSIVGNAFKDVFFQRATELNNSNVNLSSFYTKSIIIMMILCIPFSFLFFVEGPRIFSILFGEEWAEAGEIARWVSIWVAFIMISRPAVALIQIFKKQGLNLSIEVVFSILKILLFSTISVISQNLILSLIILIFVNAIQYLMLIYIGFMEIKKRSINSTIL